VVVVQDVQLHQEMVVATMLVMVVLDQPLVRPHWPILEAEEEAVELLDLHQLVVMVVLEL
jgi:hypothetical protein